MKRRKNKGDTHAGQECPHRGRLRLPCGMVGPILLSGGMVCEIGLYGLDLVFTLGWHWLSRRLASVDFTGDPQWD